LPLTVWLWKPPPTPDQTCINAMDFSALSEKPPPRVHGQPPKTVVTLICAAHFCICVIVIAVSNAISTVRFAGLEITPTVQILNAAWAVLGIPPIVIAFLGTIYHVATHMPYILYLGSCIVCAMIETVLFIKYNKCDAGSDCIVMRSMLFFKMFAAIGCALVALHFVLLMKEHLDEEEYDAIVEEAMGLSQKMGPLVPANPQGKIGLPLPHSGPCRA